MFEDISVDCAIQVGIRQSVEPVLELSELERDRVARPIQFAEPLKLERFEFGAEIIELRSGGSVPATPRAVAQPLVPHGCTWSNTSKALARFRALDDRDFAEYVLIGTLTSLLLALLVGVGVRIILR